MLSRSAKAAFYWAAGPAMAINGTIHRRFRAPRAERLRVHLGPGQKNYLPGWCNVDANMFTARCDIWADLRNPLPFQDAAADAVYSHHVLEHLPNMEHHFSDVYRCLKPGGWYRVGGPNGDSAIRKFIENDHGWFGDFPDRRSSIGGRFENFVFCRQEHLTILTDSFLREMLATAGFVEITNVASCTQTLRADLFGDCLGIEHESDPVIPHTLMLEARKPP